MPTIYGNNVIYLELSGLVLAQQTARVQIFQLLYRVLIKEM